MRIAFLGPIAEPGKAAKGGVESGTREIISSVEDAGLNTVEFPYPAPDRHQSAVRKGLAYAIGLPGLVMRVVFSAKSFSLLHLTSLYRAYLYPELMTVALVRLLGRPVVLHLRPGDWWLQYRQRSGFYRICFRQLIRLSNGLLVESESLLEPARSLGGNPVLVPSFVVAEPVLRSDDSRSPELVLVYAGALNSDKGIPEILAARRLLAESGQSVELHLYGDGEPGFVEEIKRLWPDPDVHWHGEVPHELVRKHLRAGHFFLFPTRFIGEGHANALNEAMAEGVVPVVSDHGANSDVVGDAGFVLPASAGPGDYADVVRAVLNENTWLQHSHACSERVRTKFWSAVVMAEILNTYKNVTNTA